jgi:hypothetical protein
MGKGENGDGLGGPDNIVEVEEEMGGMSGATNGRVAAKHDFLIL